MTISIIGTPQAGSAINGGNVTLTFNVTPSQNDVVVVFGGSGTFRTPLPAAPTGYTQIAIHESGSDIWFGAWYKIMGASPDSNVVGNGTGNAADAAAYICYVLRGVDLGTPLDTAATTAGVTTSTNPDCPSITTVANNAWVLAVAGNRVSDADIGTVSGYSNQYQAQGNDTNAMSVGGATKEIASPGAENPAAWTTWLSGTWFAITIAIRPATNRSHIALLGVG